VIANNGQAKFITKHRIVRFEFKDLKVNGSLNLYRVLNIISTSIKGVEDEKVYDWSI